MQHKVYGILILLTYLFCFSLKAESLLHFTAGVSYWNSKPSGSFGESSDALLTLDKDSSQQSNYYFSIEHTFPLLPNIKISKTATTNPAVTVLDKTFILNNDLYRVASVLDTVATYEQLDVITYYEMFDNRTLEFDLGLAFRDHSIHVTVDNRGSDFEMTSLQVSDLQVLTFAAAKVNFPLLKLSGFSEVIFWDSNTYDVQTGVRYAFDVTTLAKTYLQVGVKKQIFDFSNLEGLNTSLEWESVFVGFETKF